MVFKKVQKFKFFKESPNLLFVKYAQDNFLHVPFCPHKKGKKSYRGVVLVKND